MRPRAQRLPHPNSSECTTVSPDPRPNATPRQLGHRRPVSCSPNRAKPPGDHLASFLALGPGETIVVGWDRDFSNAAVGAGLAVAPSL
jgi:hypothetical protein